MVLLVKCAPLHGLDVGGGLRLSQRRKCGSRGDIWNGGVGKTTLLRKINNKTTHGFNVGIWVVVSKEVNEARIQNDIRNRLGLSWQENTSNERRATDIHKALSNMKFTLLLDDIWQRLDLEMVGIPRPNSQNKSKVVFTTRSEDVCGHMDADKKAKVKCLTWKEGWDLFREKVSEEALNSHREIPGLAEVVAKECGGLPLALITIGRAMASKKTPQEWKHAITALRRSPSEIPGMEDEVLFHLKFSYDNLGGDTIKSCFLYCSLFPEDYAISKESLIDYWIGEGFVDGWDGDLEEARNKGHDLIGTLKLACLLESGSDEETEVKMHDVIRDLALWISSECGKKKNKFLVQAGVGLNKAPAVERWTEEERISLMKNGIKEITETPSCPNLLTLMLQWNRDLAKITNGFFQFMPHLRVLDLSNNQIKEIPPEIGNLVELQYLILSHSWLGSLPKEIGDLSKLKHLDVGYTEFLRRIPPLTISRLSWLKVLKLLDSFGNWEEIEGITEMEELKCLSHLEITIGSVPVLKRFLNSHMLPKLTRILTIKNCRGMTSTQLSSTFSAMGSLRDLKIHRCIEMKKMMIGADVKKEDDISVSSLERLSLSELFNLNIVRVGGCIQNLRYIEINFCHSLKDVTWILQLQNLEEILIQHCERLKEVISSSDVGIPVGEECLRSFKILYLRDLPELTGICNDALSFPSLVKLDVYYCPKLKNLPLSFRRKKDNLLKSIVSDNLAMDIVREKEWWDRMDGI